MKFSLISCKSRTSTVHNLKVCKESPILKSKLESPLFEISENKCRWRCTSERQGFKGLPKSSFWSSFLSKMVCLPAVIPGHVGAVPFVLLLRVPGPTTTTQRDRRVNDLPCLFSGRALNTQVGPTSSGRALNT